jgi:murein DD-endopeptidase MepM/ murein hydrolase activator NlpD
VRAPTPTLCAAAACALVLAVAAGAAPSDRSGGATARAWGVQVLVPGRAGVASRVLGAAPDRGSRDGPLVYPADGSVAAASSVAAGVSAGRGTSPSARASAEVDSLSLFGGELRAERVTGGVRAGVGASGATGGAAGTGIVGLVVLGRPVTPRPNRLLALGDWGYAILLEQEGQAEPSPVLGYHEFAAGLDVFLTAAHGGLPAGSEVQVGYAEAAAQAAAPAPLPAAPSTVRGTPGGPVGAPPARPPAGTPPLGRADRVFPVYGGSSFADTFGALRGDVSGDWHHGVDVFVPHGTPVLACADGTVFSVGWNAVGGWRLWLRDAHGNDFYYAHLAGYSPFAVDGEEVHAGDVLGFVGDSGDAEGTPYHLHFEVHPAGLLALGYDGAVDPSGYLRSWRRVRAIPLDAAGWIGTAPSSARAPRAGAVLLRQRDISTASGLAAGSLQRVAGP